MQLDQQAQDQVAFEKASATDLPFEDESFTHLWSQAVIYHVPDKMAVLAEAYRVLEKGGTMVFDDLTKPNPTSARTPKNMFMSGSSTTRHSASIRTKTR